MCVCVCDLGVGRGHQCVRRHISSHRVGGEGLRGAQGRVGSSLQGMIGVRSPAPSRLPLCLQKVNEFVTAMEQTSYNIKTELPGLLDHSRRILGLYKRWL